MQILKHWMIQAIEENSVRKGYDPRDFALVAEGGAGPLFACEIALELGIPAVVVPPYPGITAAMGLLATDIVYEYVATERHALGASTPRVCSAATRGSRTRAVCSSPPTAWPGERRLLRRLADCRYLGQGYELRFDVPAGPIDSDWVRRVQEGFHRAHEREYCHRFERRDRARQHPSYRNRQDRRVDLAGGGAGTS